MSRVPEHNSPGLPIDPDVADKRESERDAAPSNESEFDTASTEATEILINELEDEDDEFSLSQLSQAYAKLKRTEADQAAESAALAEEVPDGHQQSPTAVKVSRSRESTAMPITASTAEGKEARDNAGCSITPASIIEAIVFVGLPGDEKLTVKKISSLLRDVSPKEIKSIVKQLNERYENEQAAYRIMLSGESISMELHESMLPFQQELSRQNKGVKLNAATIEVLAVIAYNQPITREKIDDTRKKPSSAIVSQLVKRGLVAPTAGERSAQKQQFITTAKFLNLFHLADVADLPRGTDVSDLDELLS